MARDRLLVDLRAPCDNAGCCRSSLGASPPSGGAAPHITVIIPARDEEANIAPCLRSVLAQDYPGDRFDVLVVDDHSADATADIVRGLAARHRHITLVPAPPLPARWIGKPHACWIGARTVAPEADGCASSMPTWADRAPLFRAPLAPRAAGVSISCRSRRGRSCTALPNGSSCRAASFSCRSSRTCAKRRHPPASV